MLEVCRAPGHEGNLGTICCAAEALDDIVFGGAQVVIVPTPESTNALVLHRSAPSIPAENITTLTRLAHNRMLAQVCNTALHSDASFSLLQMRRARPVSSTCMLLHRWQTNWLWQ